MTYNYNANLGYYGDTPATLVGLGAIQYPAQTITTCENGPYGSKYIGSTGLGAWAMRTWPATDPYYWGEWWLPHNDGCNLTFCDGHAKWYSMQGRNVPTGASTAALSKPYKIPGLYIMPNGSN